MTQLSQSNWFIWAASFLPGLGLILLGKKRLGLGAALLVFLLLALFWFIPNLFTWFIFGAAFISQMAYAVALATINSLVHSPAYRATARSYKLPERFADKKRIVAEVLSSFSQILGSDEQLRVAIVGHKHNSSRLMFAGVTEKHLVISSCSQAGNPSDSRRIPRNEVMWVSLQIDMARSLLTIETEGGEKISLDVPGKLNEQARSIVQEFPGTWSSAQTWDGLIEYHKQANRREVTLVYIGGVILMYLVIIISAEQRTTLSNLLVELVFPVVLFAFGWPGFVSLVRSYKKEPGQSSAISSAFFWGISTALCWIASIYLTYESANALVKALQALG